MQNENVIHLNLYEKIKSRHLLFQVSQRIQKTSKSSNSDAKSKVKFAKKFDLLDYNRL